MHRGGPELAGQGLPWPQGAQELIMLAAVGPEEDALYAFNAWCAEVDIESHLDGGSFRLLPLVYDRLQRRNIAHPLMGRLKGVYRRAWYENNRLFGDIAPILAELKAAGVPTMLLKGAALAHSWYPSLATRPMLDIDLVVPRDKVEQAFAVLERCGWTANDRVKPHERPEAHALDFRNAEGRELDLHWHCLRETPSAQADAWFWDQARPFSFCGVETLQPSPTSMLLQIVLHGVRSNIEPPIRWIADATVLLRAAADQIDWPQIERFAIQHRLTYRLHLGLDYLKTVYGAPVPQGVLQRLGRRSISLIERIENIIYLGDARRMYRPRLFPAVDYFRFLRVQTPLAFAAGFASYLRRRWELKSSLQIPIALMAAAVRQAGSKREA